MCHDPSTLGTIYTSALIKIAKFTRFVIPQRRDISLAHLRIGAQILESSMVTGRGYVVASVSDQCSMTYSHRR
jgi:hypothetical protein